MATRGRTTFQKRQKEMARKERQERKAERREHRKMTRSIEEKTPPQDPAQESTEHDGFEHTGQSPDWRPSLREDGDSE
jgi:hypothetical protein